MFVKRHNFRSCPTAKVVDSHFHLKLSFCCSELLTEKEREREIMCMCKCFKRERQGEGRERGGEYGVCVCVCVSMRERG